MYALIEVTISPSDIRVMTINEDSVELFIEVVESMGGTARVLSS